MTTQIRIGRFLALCLMLPFFFTSGQATGDIVSSGSTTGAAQNADFHVRGRIGRTDGTVTVNGTSAISGATVLSDSTVTTAKGSSAVVSLGKLGRVEVAPDSTMKVSFTDSSFTLSMLDASATGQTAKPRKAIAVNGTTPIRWLTSATRVWSSSGVVASVTTNQGQVVGDGSKKNEFIVDTSCGNTFVSVQRGSVELRAGNSVKQIAAGSQDTAGQARPGCTTPVRR